MNGASCRAALACAARQLVVEVLGAGTGRCLATTRRRSRDSNARVGDRIAPCCGSNANAARHLGQVRPSAPCTCCRAGSGCTSRRRPRPSMKTRSHASSIASAHSRSPIRRRRVSLGSSSPRTQPRDVLGAEQPAPLPATRSARAAPRPARASGPSTQSVIGTLMPNLRRQTMSSGRRFWSASLSTYFSHAPCSFSSGGSGTTPRPARGRRAARARRGPTRSPCARRAAGCSASP